MGTITIYFCKEGRVFRTEVEDLTSDPDADLWTILKAERDIKGTEWYDHLESQELLGTDKGCWYPYAIGVSDWGEVKQALKDARQANEVFEEVSDFLTDRGYNEEEDDEWDISDSVHCAINQGCGTCYTMVRDLLIKEKARDLLGMFVDVCDRWETDDHEKELDFLLGDPGHKEDE